MKCPVCRAVYKPSPEQACRRCGADLAALIRVHDQAVWHYRAAITALESRDLSRAQEQIGRALFLHSQNADYHAFAGQLWALQGNFQGAIAAWRKATAIDAKHPTALNALQAVATLVSETN
jgi:tetratricopeptide (TPR) repeat protein